MLAVAGTLAIHLIIAVFFDALVVLYPMHEEPPAPRLELVDVEVPPIVTPPPPPVPQAAPIPAPAPAAHVAHVAHAAPAHVPEAAPVEHVLQHPEPTPEPTGGAPVISEPDLAPSATGVGVAVGPRTTGHIGRGGHGGGTGTGTGAGSAVEMAPMSVATIKQRAMPRGDYSYQEAKDYPEEAKQLDIEGKIRVKLVVDEHGAVKSAVLLNRLGHGLDELALRRASSIVFDPARDSDDHPVASVVVWTFDMTLPK